MRCDGPRRQDHLAPWRAPWTAVELLLSRSRRATRGSWGACCPGKASGTVGLEMLLACLPRFSVRCCGCCWPCFTLLCWPLRPRRGAACSTSTDRGSGLGVREAQISESIGSHPQGLPSPFPQPRPPTPPRLRGSVTPLSHMAKMSVEKVQWKIEMGNGQWKMAVENSMAEPQRIPHKVTAGSSNSMSAYLDEWTESRDLNGCWDTCVHSSVIHNRHKVEMAQMPINGWQDKQTTSVRTNGAYSALEREKALLRAVTQKNLENTMLSEISRSQRTNIIGLYWYEVPRVVESIETEVGW